MNHAIAAFALLISSPLAFGQVIFAPSEQPRAPGSYCYPFERLDPKAALLIDALQGPPRPVYIANGTPPIFAAPRPIVVPSGQVISPEALGVDPLTGQPLYFRKRDLLPQAPPDGEDGAQDESSPPTTQPSQPSYPAQGQIIIKPWRGGGRTNNSR